MLDITFDQIFWRTVVDTDQSDLFSQLGRERSPFQGVQSWPYLDEEFEKYSIELNKRLGCDRWRELGGERDEHGPTLRFEFTGAPRKSNS